ncbi:hypothetical protein D3C75_830910 [compost metagenome]
MADVLEHADTHHLVEPTVLGQITVVEQLQLDQILQPLIGHPFTGQRQLLLAQGDAKHPGPELPRRITRQPSPTAAYIQQVLAGLQP